MGYRTGDENASVLIKTRDSKPALTDLESPSRSLDLFAEKMRDVFAPIFPTAKLFLKSRCLFHDVLNYIKKNLSLMYGNTFFFAPGFSTKIITFILFYIFIEIYRIWIQSEINRAEDYVSDKSWLITRVKHWNFLIRKFSVMFIWKLFKWQAMCEIQFIVFLINWHFFSRMYVCVYYYY